LKEEDGLRKVKVKVMENGAKVHSAEYHTGIKSDRVTSKGSSRTLNVLSDPGKRICIYTPRMLGSWS
jgi:hypothetical protein